MDLIRDILKIYKISYTLAQQIIILLSVLDWDIQYIVNKRSNVLSQPVHRTVTYRE